MSDWPEHIMGPEENYLLPPDADKTPPRVRHVGPLTHDGIAFPHMRAEEYTAGEGYAPNPFGQWMCVCGWSTEYGMEIGGSRPSRMISPESVAAYQAERNRAIYHAERCDGTGRAKHQSRNDE